MRGVVATAVGCVLLVSLASAQTKPLTRKPAPKPPARTAQAARRTEAVDMGCPQVLGAGVATRRTFCNVLTGMNPADGVLLHLPERKGPAIVTFDLHNLHTYSEELVKARKAYAAYTATIGVLTDDGQLVMRGVVQTEFRTAKDLFDRVGGGAGPGGVKAVAPVGCEPIRVEIPEGYNELSLLGEKLSVISLNGNELFTAPGRPIAVVSNVWVDYAPLPPKAPVRKKK